MDKLGTYALVAALKEISKNSAEKKPLGVAQNERWISLRSCARELPSTLIEAPSAPHYEDLRHAPIPADTAGPFDRHAFAQQRLAQAAQLANPTPSAPAQFPQAAQAVLSPQPSPQPAAQTLSTSRRAGSYSAIRQIEMRHMAARRGER